jgi:hypothetical protein
MHGLVIAMVVLGQPCPPGGCPPQAPAFFPALDDVGLLPWWEMPQGTKEERKAREAARLEWFEQRRISLAMQKEAARQQRLTWKRSSGYYDARRNANLPTIQALQRVWFYRMGLPYPYTTGYRQHVSRFPTPYTRSRQ